MHNSNDKPEALELAVRRKLYDIVKHNAGCHFREIQRISGLSFGSASYHLNYLKKNQLIKETREDNNLRYFPTQIALGDEKLLTLLRQHSIRKIILSIFSNDGVNHQELSSMAHLSPSTTTWHLRKLLDSGIISSDKKGKYTVYYLNIPKDRIMKLLITYQESFLDELVDGLIELWEPQY